MKPFSYWAVVWAGLVILWGFAALLYASLPEHIPGHFGLGGAVTRWDPKSTFWLLPLAASLVVLLTYFLLHLALKNRDFLNLPHKAIFEALPLNKQEKVLQHLDHRMAGLSFITLLLFGQLQYEVYRVAAGQAQKQGLGIWVLLLGLGLYVVWMLLDLGRAVQREAQRTR
ncbi:DUF1648 domain-containing protein [Meiothermus sp.]|jgi:hypothetical protein|uniref:DUF1648 domain-containing protein n=1 Tax=Meiothermus sp. TaxID=1955249 RepID=UPI0021DC618A|nr:DUF1648 domain-containing protein [Meiothermus sp.]GIW24455.1 MAG: hypothetical protein KatS3mg069_0722 [Meiothermus sp.]